MHCNINPQGSYLHSLSEKRSVKFLITNQDGQSFLKHDFRNFEDNGLTVLEYRDDGTKWESLRQINAIYYPL